MPEGHHKSTPIQVTVDVDEGIAGMVLYLNTIPGVRTHASCQGTIGEGGPHPYRPQVLVTWDDEPTFERLAAEFDMSEVSREGNWCYVHPREGWTTPADASPAAGEIVADPVELALATIRQELSTARQERDYARHTLTTVIVNLRRGGDPLVVVPALLEWYDRGCK